MAQNPVTGAPVRLVVTDEDGTFLDLGGEDFSRERFSAVFARMRADGCRFAVEWDDINLQDLVEEAKAELYREQARRLRLENDEREEQT